jgi:hypothetical protein
MNPINEVLSFLNQHGILVLFLYIIFNAYVGSLRAPTAKSGQTYVSFFAVMNALAANFGRMFPKVENSPNFEPAVNLQQNLAGQPVTPVQVPPIVEKQ